MQSVFYNKDLFTNILSYLDNNDFHIKQKINAFRGLLHYDYIRSTTQLLLYGQVQSGKTSKIMDFVTKFKCNKLKILVIQNNILMLNQYVKALSHRGITHKVIGTNDSLQIYENEQVLITIYNKFRIKTLNTFIKQNNITNYSLILDESDQYLNRIKVENVFKHSKEILHVTATPFIYASNFQTDKVIKINPKWNYIGLNQVKINEVNMCDDNSKKSIVMKISEIVRNDFLKTKVGLMLINCFARIKDMKKLASSLSFAYKNIPIVVFSNKTYIYLNGPKLVSKVTNFQKFIDNFVNINHAIFIAGRLSNRGINYTNSDYSRYITHQISIGGGNYTNFIQKCRIFGNRNLEMIGHDDSAIRPTIYCIIREKNHQKFVKYLMNKVRMLEKNLNVDTDVKPDRDFELSLNTVKQLHLLCKEKNIKNYSKLKKNDIIELIRKHDEMEIIEYI